MNDKVLSTAFCELKLEALLQGKKEIYFKILSNGMSYTITTKDEVLVKKANLKDLMPGDIIVYRRPDQEFTAHRIISRCYEGGKEIFYTKADLGNRLDPPVSGEQIAGQVIAIKKPWGFFRLNTISGRLISREIHIISVLIFRFRSILSKLIRLLSKTLNLMLEI